MKKAYISPSVRKHNVRLTQIIATSPSYGNGTADKNKPVLSKGSFFDDDDDDDEYYGF